MAAWRYEISLLVLKKYFTHTLHSLVKFFSTLEEKFCISMRPCNILYLLRPLSWYKITDRMPEWHLFGISMPGFLS